MSGGVSITHESAVRPGLRTLAAHGRPDRDRRVAAPTTADLPREPINIDPALLRLVLGHYPTGVAVITAMTSDGPVGMAVNSFTSVSLHPPLVSFCAALASTTWPALRAIGRIGINVLSAQQHEVSRSFATKAIDRFAETPWITGRDGSPRLTDALAWLECTIESELAAGDHTLVLSRVEHLETHESLTDPLIFFRGRYFSTLA